MKIVGKLNAASSALTNSTTHTALGSISIPANGLQKGQVWTVTGTGICTSTNSTDTFRARVYVSTATLSGTAISDTGAVDATNNDVFVFHLYLDVREVSGTSATVVCYGNSTVLGAEGTVTARASYEVLTLTTTNAHLIELSGVWSVASASNSARADSFVLGLNT